MLPLYASSAQSCLRCRRRCASGARVLKEGPSRPLGTPPSRWKTLEAGGSSPPPSPSPCGFHLHFIVFYISQECVLCLCVTRLPICQMPPKSCTVPLSPECRWNAVGSHVGSVRKGGRSSGHCVPFRARFFQRAPSVPRCRRAQMGLRRGAHTVRIYACR
jgi:hypothetical protein